MWARVRRPPAPSDGAFPADDTRERVYEARRTGPPVPLVRSVPVAVPVPVLPLEPDVVHDHAEEACSGVHQAVARAADDLARRGAALDDEQDAVRMSRDQRRVAHGPGG